MKFFTKWETNDDKILSEYEGRIRHLFGFNVDVRQTQENVARNLWVENPNPYFLWSEIEPEETMKKFD